MKAWASQRWASLVAKDGARPKRVTRLTKFRAKHPYFGPVIYWVTVVYFAAQLLASLVWTPSYSWFRNSISSLGNTSCGPQLCSPRHAWMNAAFIVLGIVMLVGSYFIFGEFTEKEPEERLAALIGFWCLGLGGAGAVLVGFAPENSAPIFHIIGAILAIGVGTLGVWILGFGIARSLSKRLVWGMRVVPPVAIAAGILFGLHVHLGIGGGTLERLAAYPETIWLIAFGLYIGGSHYSRTHHSASKLRTNSHPRPLRSR